MSKYLRCFNRTVSAVVLAVMLMLIMLPQNLANDMDDLSEIENTEIDTVETEEEPGRMLLLPEELEEQSDETEEEPERTLLLPEELEEQSDETEEEPERMLLLPEEVERLENETEEVPEEFFEEPEEFFEEPEEFFEEPLANMLLDLTYMEETPYSLDDYSQQSGTNRTEEVVITYWDIRYWVNETEYYSLSDSEDYSAIPNAGYQLVFQWELNVSGTDQSTLQAGDHFKLKLPKNEQSGWWSALKTEPSYLYLNGQTEICGEWMIQELDDEENGEIGIWVVFNDRVTGYRKIEGIEMSTGKNSLTNLTLNGCTQNVSFGVETATSEENKKKMITFKQHGIGLLGHWDVKRFTKSSNRTILWQIGVGAAATSGLTGYWYGFYERESINYEWAHKWGSLNSSDGSKVPVYNSFNTIVEDKLERGVTVDAIYIAARTMVPLNVTEEDGYLYDLYGIHLSEHKGGPASWEPAFASYVLAYFDGTQHYRDSGDGDSLHGILKPTRDYSFTLVEQSNGELYEDFKTRLNPYQYGIYSDGGEPATLTVVINFGNIGTNNTIYKNDQPRYLDLAENFVDQSVDACIKKGYYSETDRTMLEAYFYAVYGGNNAIEGRVANYMIDLHVTYPPNTPNEKGDGTKKNGDDGVNTKITWKELNENKITNSISAEGELEYLTGLVSLASNTARLIKYDVDTNESLEGVGFKLQQFIGTEWLDYGIKDFRETKKYDSNNDGEVDGDAYVEWTDLPNGTYRFVEVAPLMGYDLENSEGFNNDLGTCVSKEFTINSPDDGKYIYLSNKASSDATLTFSFIKIDQFEIPLEGVEFELYHCTLGDSHQHSDTVRYDEECCWTRLQPMLATSNEIGKVEFYPLSPGDYMLVETYTPELYILPAGQWRVRLISEMESVIESVAVNGVFPPELCYKEGYYNFYLTNYQPMNLPETGGKGTEMFGIAGTVMTGASGGILLYIKRKRKK